MKRRAGGFSLIIKVSRGRVEESVSTIITDFITITITDEPADGSDGQAPETYIKACGGNRTRAWAKYQQTLAWRSANHVDHILDMPQKHFHTIKKYYPHFVHGLSKSGEIVVYEFPGIYGCCCVILHNSDLLSLWHNRTNGLEQTQIFGDRTRGNRETLHLFQ